MLVRVGVLENLVGLSFLSCGYLLTSELCKLCQCRGCVCGIVVVGTPSTPLCSNGQSTAIAGLRFAASPLKLLLFLYERRSMKRFNLLQPSALVLLMLVLISTVILNGLGAVTGAGEWMVRPTRRIIGPVHESRSYDHKAPTHRNTAKPDPTTMLPAAHSSGIPRWALDREHG